MAGKNPKFFRIATEGATSDGRVIDREMLVQMAASYDPDTYGARINLEHIRGIVPDGPFKAYGDVLALKTEEEGGKMRLYAQLDPTAELIAFNKARQKVFCSMEVNPDFADTGEAYLVGLAVTDNPASLGCEMLQFSAKAKTNPLAERKQDPNNLFSEAVPVELDFPSDTPATAPAAGFAASIKKLFARQDKSDAGNDARHADMQEAVQTIAKEVQSLGETFSKAINGVTERLDALQADQAKDKEAFSTLKGALEKKEDFSRRPPATGGDGSVIETDC
ncbi:GPO family capsid scaffolding protein [Cupriavidus taiwanensis]|uniref:Bacteriophage P2 GPO capsid protein Presumed capsid scaffolding protein n=1 Tax=Cupriavidus taiwanensis (strain DSM 17343 / BCRC 17206 / CCUG 44338 / CIP 107171 / LMG 19424 / R1) TaxID=977880 RepID=B3R3L5_CUPTR|nr:GPO family capsid scaffolding protein [Cupriavidus taiwanensis]CAQ68898.1 bacteriophage P2 GPO capsid protein; Presumed capsid scaffolding protein [Cupriavidus taiwanensis LMG 19424]